MDFFDFLSIHCNSDKPDFSEIKEIDNTNGFESVMSNIALSRICLEKVQTYLSRTAISENDDIRHFLSHLKQLEMFLAHTSDPIYDSLKQVILDVLPQE